MQRQNAPLVFKDCFEILDEPIEAYPVLLLVDNLRLNRSRVCACRRLLCQSSPLFR